MFKMVFQTAGIVGAWGVSAWIGLALFSMFGVEIPDSNVTGILAVAAVAFLTSVTMEIRDWCRFNRLVVEKRS